MTYHTFLSYNTKNFVEAQKIFEYLTNSGVKVFFDKKSISLGDPFQKKLEEGLLNSASVIVLVGPGGVGPWQREEVYMSQILEIAKNRNLKIIPVFLPGVSADDPHLDIPTYLNLYHRLEFEESVNEMEKMHQLIVALPKIEISDEFERPLLEEQEEMLLRNSIIFYDNNAHRYYDKWKDDFPAASMEGFLKEFRKHGRKAHLLDAGCGPGHHSNVFAKRGHSVIGIDRCAKFIQIAEKNKLTDCSFVHGDMRKLNSVFKKRNIFDGIWACGSCVHLVKEAIDHQLYEFLAILKPMGVLGMSLQVEAPTVIQDDGRFFERYSIDEYQKKLEALGFHIISVNTELDDHSTTADRNKVKKWHAVVAIAPEHKPKLRPSKSN